MIRPASAFYAIPQHPASRDAIVRHLGHFVGELRAANTDTEALAHCPTCAVFLLPHESCLHMPAVGVAVPHLASCSVEGQHDHVG